MDSKILQKRTKTFALNIIELTKLLPNNRVGWVFTDQIVRSATSVAANYRAVCRARSDKEFISKMGIVIEEADETLFWLEMIAESKTIDSKKYKSADSNMTVLMKEADELISIFVSSVKTIKKRLNHKS